MKNIEEATAIRIALALERIATALESKTAQPRTTFPWSEISEGTRKRIMDEIIGAKMSGLMPYSWPLSCEDLMDIGPGGLRDFRFIGNKAIAEIRAKLDSLGFRWATESKTLTHQSKT